ncbi:dihydroorotase [Desulfocurvibacter africanus PCS]|uniref:Dihydroorotase n=1 Tax=Desulfocurvibacter africanus PCS TaxID=1262666 RepID=M5Q1B5_DESAF|nr:dihydroorotase [Desulfocurvibacter africanus]EMG37426.1 dihydroorotase [Desulfocurvibacter africanus PCS]
MAAPELVIRNARRMGRAVDLLVADGKVLELTDHAPDRDYGATQNVDAGGAILLPALIDAHTHLREPGFEYKEDIASGLAAAAHGGFGRIMCMANTRPVNDHAPITQAMLGAARKAWPQGPFLHPIGALTKDLKGQELAPMAELAEVGCVAFSNDGLPVADTERFRRAVEYAASVGRPVIDHCEDPHMAPAAGVNEGAISSRLGLRGQPDVAEAVQVARDILLAEYLAIPIHLAHISCIRSLEFIRAAKARGVAVTAETCPHYLLLTEEAVDGYRTEAKVNPPLRTQADLQAMRAAVADGTIDMLATDHAPHAAHEKDVEFDLAPCGISGLDTALPLTWDLVREGVLDEAAFCRLWHERPAEVFGLPANRFQPGDPADFILFDPEARWTLTAEAMRSKGKNTPFLGREMRGRCTLLAMAGNVVLG